MNDNYKNYDGTPNDIVGAFLLLVNVQTRRLS